MSTVTIESNSIGENYIDGVLTRVTAHGVHDHPVHGVTLFGVVLPTNRLIAWVAANDSGKMNLLRSEVAVAGQRLETTLDTAPVHTFQVLDDSIFGDPIEL